MEATQEFSKLFVVVMGMGVTFVGLILIIFLTMLMGKIITALDHSAPQNAAVPAPVPAAAPAVPADGVIDEVKVAILAALAQEPGFRMEHITNINIRQVCSAMRFQAALRSSLSAASASGML